MSECKFFFAESSHTALLGTIRRVLPHLVICRMPYLLTSGLEHPVRINLPAAVGVAQCRQHIGGAIQNRPR